MAFACDPAVRTQEIAGVPYQEIIKALHGIAKALTVGGFGCGCIDSHDFKGHWLGMKNYRNHK